ncbi:PHP domain-containing protein [Muricomes sp. OA1]|uniref:PHP domain-containing protein n=1 Tax=Hungatella hathewayi TaxID=154046 RepID=A0A3E2WM90_9FIRM|nr:MULTISPECIES: PHP domain-containing protein [Clostridia]MCH1971929.1 PHP domain-containing protein [Muricomes sp. OA1]MEE0201743.1 PHP domain-containing protein [Muricomes sp.]RGC27810.1 PHP domain-containing protein [Hungatella hathewayi]GKH30729.1 phosphatase [Faecalicatena contorta]
MNWLDLHMHSVISDDGEFEPEKLMDMCREAGLKTVAVADHNSTKALGRAAARAKENGLRLIPAVELDCCIRGRELHILGYGIDPEYPEYGKVEQNLLAQEQESSKIRLRLAEEAGLIVDHDLVYELAHHGVVTGEVIAEAALKNEENHALLRDYLPGGKRSDNPYVNFYWDWCSQGKCAYAPVEFISLDRAVEIITASGGVPILAHPGNNTREDEMLLQDIVKAGVRGMEVFSSYHTDEQVEFYLDWAMKRQLLITAGSDFHGKTKPSIHLGRMDVKGLEDKIYKELMDAV